MKEQMIDGTERIARILYCQQVGCWPSSSWKQQNGESWADYMAKATQIISDPSIRTYFLNEARKELKDSA